jgi:membrane protein implicated in regulation of membrane protease activity
MALLEWYNLIFLVPIALATVYLVVLTMGLSGGEDGAAVGDNLSHPVDAPGGILTGVLSFLGIGKAPISVLLISYALVWGVTGLASLRLLGPERIVTAIALAAALSVALTGRLSDRLARLLPSVETYHVPLDRLVGLRGEVLYEITTDSGVVRVRDADENLRDVAARLAEGSAPAAAGTRVLLERFDPHARVFIVRC